MAVALRIGSGLVIVGTAILAGYWFRSPWIIALLAVCFTILYVGGKLAQWKAVVRTHGVGAVGKALAATLPIQTVLCGIFYLIGSGIGALAGQRAFADRLEGFDFALAGGLVVFGLSATVAVQVLEARGSTNSDAGFSAEMKAIIAEASALGKQAVAMPVQIFSLARRLADHPDRQETLAAMERFFDAESAFVRRIPFTALRFMGQDARDLDPDELDRRIVEGMADPAVWVRYDAAWVAGEIVGDDAAFTDALSEMIRVSEAAGADGLDENAAEHKALLRARMSINAIEHRSGP